MGARASFLAYLYSAVIYVNRDSLFFADGSIKQSVNKSSLSAQRLCSRADPVGTVFEWKEEKHHCFMNLFCRRRRQMEQFDGICHSNPLIVKLIFWGYLSDFSEKKAAKFQLHTT